MKEIQDDEDWFFKDHGFPEPNLIIYDQVVPELYCLTNNGSYNDYLRCNENLQDIDPLIIL